MAGQYEKVKFLGQGGFGKVYLVRKKQDPKQLFAMKEMSISKQSMQQISKEVELLRALDHPYILALKGGFVKDISVYIITEYCPNGDLQQYISKTSNQPLKKSLVLRWFMQISRAVKYLHSEKVIHRDLKLANIFLDSNINCKLGDFGISRVLEFTLEMARTQAGTPCYMSPELINGIPYNEKTDIWSLAIVIYELATLRKAFNADSIKALYNKITDGPIPSMPKNYPVAFQELLSSMMKRNPDHRPSASQIRQTLSQIAIEDLAAKQPDVKEKMNENVRQWLGRSPLPPANQNERKDKAKQDLWKRQLKQPQMQAYVAASPMQPQQMQLLMQPCIQTPLQLQPQPMMPQMQPQMQPQPMMPQMQPQMQQCMQPLMQSPLQLQAIPQQPMLQQPMLQQPMLPQMQPWPQQPLQVRPAVPQMQVFMYQGMQPPM